MRTMTNPESWADVIEFAHSLPDTDHWNCWRAAMLPILEESRSREYDTLFRAGSSMHDFVFSTLDRHRLFDEPRVTLTVTEDFRLRIAYSRGNVHFSSPSESIVEDSREAFPSFTRYLCHLWEETMPEPIPEVLRKG